MVSEYVCLSAKVVSLKDGDFSSVKNFEQFNNSLAEL